MKNEMKIEFDAKSENEGFARIAVAGFLTNLDPSIEEMSDVKTAVSEAVTNAIIHAYKEEGENKVVIKGDIIDNIFTIEVIDTGVGIEDVERAMEPLFTTKTDEERSGMGFSFMEAFMNSLEVISIPGMGTTVKMTKVIENASHKNHVITI